MSFLQNCSRKPLTVMRIFTEWEGGVVKSRTSKSGQFRSSGWQYKAKRSINKTEFQNSNCISSNIGSSNNNSGRGICGTSNNSGTRNIGISSNSGSSEICFFFTVVVVIVVVIVGFK